jgi:hypothetical protein
VICVPMECLLPLRLMMFEVSKGRFEAPDHLFEARGAAVDVGKSSSRSSLFKQRGLIPAPVKAPVPLPICPLCLCLLA